MRITCSFFTAIASLLSLSACSTSQPEPAPAPGPPIVAAPAPTPAPTPVSGDWTVWPIAEGNWVYRQDERGSIALFGPPQSNATLTIRCDQNQRKIYISQAGRSQENAKMTLRASSGLSLFETRATGGGAPYYTAISLDPSDYMLDRIAFSRGRFAIETAGLQSLAIPIWPEFTRVVEDCRS